MKSGSFASLVKESAKGQKISNSIELYNILSPIFAGKDKEEFVIVFLNSKNNIMKIKEMFSGTITSCHVYTRELVKEILKTKASAIICAHNHPSGDPKPSNEDIQITKKIMAACHSIDVQCHEHIIIGENGNYFSFSEHGQITKILSCIRRIF